MDIIFPSYSRSFRRFELGQLPATGADAAFAELDSEVAKLEEERRRQAEADAAAAAAANQMGPPAPAPAAGTGLTLSVRQPKVGDQFNYAAGTRTQPLADRAGTAFRATATTPSGEFVGPPAPDQSTSSSGGNQNPKSNTMMYVGIAAGVLVVGGAAFYFLRKKG